jgi:hypothetical protein
MAMRNPALFSPAASTLTLHLPACGSRPNLTPQPGTCSLGRCGLNPEPQTLLLAPRTPQVGLTMALVVLQNGW